MLTREQIDELFTFCEKKYVRFYDVQVELVDHLASAIEEKMKADSKLSFEEALHKTYKSFGIFGFGKVIEEKSTSILKGYNKKTWKEIKSRLWGTKWYVGSCLFIVLLCISFYTSSLILQYLLWFLIPLILDILFYINYKQNKKVIKKPLLIFNTVLSIVSPGASFMVFYFYPGKVEKLNPHDPKFMVIASVYCAFVSFFIIAAFVSYQVKFKAMKKALTYASILFP